MTFFPWTNAFRGRHGTGQVETTAFNIPQESVAYWQERLKKHGVALNQSSSRFGEEVIRFTDPDGLALELVASPVFRQAEPWNDGTVPAAHSLRGFHGVTAALDKPDATAKLLTDIFGWKLASEEGSRQRYQAPENDNKGNLGKTIDLLTLPNAGRATGGVGSVHHIAFRVEGDKEQLEWRQRLVGLGYQVSPVMDRTYFHSIYFREPGGILFEIATDSPGFAVDESIEELGTHLRLPAEVESSRNQIEGILEPITLPTKESYL